MDGLGWSRQDWTMNADLAPQEYVAAVVAPVIVVWPYFYFSIDVFDKSGRHLKFLMNDVIH